MSHFAVLHFTKYKGKLGAIGAHIDRLHVAHNVNPDKVGFNEAITTRSSMRLVDVLGDHIDLSKAALTENYPTKPALSLTKAVQLRIQQGHTAKTTIRKDAVLAIGAILTGSHERMLQIQAEPKLFQAWKRANFEFVAQTFGQENIVRFTLHLDEKTPHFHCVFVPINDKGRLAARSFINGASQLKAYQDQYALAMAPFGLNRGIPKVLSHRVHVTTKDYYQGIQRLAQEAQTLTAGIKKANLLKLDGVREKLTESITQLKVALAEQTTKSQHVLTTNHSLIHGAQKLAYQKKLEEASQRAYQWVKRAIPLVPFLTTQLGWKVDKTKSTRRDVVLTHPKHSRILVPTRPMPTTGHWVYASVHGGGGTLIDLLLQENWSWQQIKALADGKMVENIPTAPIEAPPKKAPSVTLDPGMQAQQAQSHLERIVPTQRSAYLTHRGIFQATYQALQGLKVSQQAAVFPLYKDFDHAGKGHLCSTISYYQDRLGHAHKYFQQGLPRGLAMLHEKELEETTKIVITESPMDALSYRQIQLEEQRAASLGPARSAAQEQPQQAANTLFLSTCGNLTDQIKRDLEQLFDVAHQKEQMVVLALDNDPAGRHMTETLSHMLAEARCSYQVAIPTQGKDWNEALVGGRRQQAAHEASKAIAQSQWQAFEPTSYEVSMLRQLGIARHTFEAFQNSIQVNEQAVLVALRDCKAGELVGSWGLHRAKEQGLQELITEAPAALTTIKGSLAAAQQIVLVSSPWEALLHYQKQVHTPRMFLANADELRQHCQTKAQEQQPAQSYPAFPAHEPKQQELIQEKSQLANTCYVHVNPNAKQSLEDALDQLLLVASQKQQELILACSSGNNPTAQLVEALLKQRSCQYTQAWLALPPNGPPLSPQLGRVISLVSALAGSNVKMAEAAYEEEERYPKAASKRMG